MHMRFPVETLLLLIQTASFHHRLYFPQQSHTELCNRIRLYKCSGQLSDSNFFDKVTSSSLPDHDKKSIFMLATEKNVPEELEGKSSVIQQNENVDEKLSIYSNRCLLLQAKILELKSIVSRQKATIKNLAADLKYKATYVQQISELIAKVETSKNIIYNLERDNEVLKEKYTKRISELEGNSASIVMDRKINHQDQNFYASKKEWTIAEAKLQSDCKKFRIRTMLLENEVIRLRQKQNSTKNGVRRGNISENKEDATNLKEEYQLIMNRARYMEENLRNEIRILREEKEAVKTDITNHFTQYIEDQQVIEGRKRQNMREKFYANIDRIRREMEGKEKKNAEDNRILKGKLQKAHQQIIRLKRVTGSELQTMDQKLKSQKKSSEIDVPVEHQDIMAAERQKAWEKALQCMDLWGV